MNLSVTPDDLSEHLLTLEVGVVRRVEGEQHTFYRLTERARTVFDENNLFEEDTCQAAYEEVCVPPEIQALEDLDQPADARDAALSHTNKTTKEYDNGKTFDTTAWQDTTEDSPL